MMTITEEVKQQWLDKDGNILREVREDKHFCQCGYVWFGHGAELPPDRKDRIPYLACPDCGQVDFISVFLCL